MQSCVFQTIEDNSAVGPYYQYAEHMQFVPVQNVISLPNNFTLQSGTPFPWDNPDWDVFVLQPNMMKQYGLHYFQAPAIPVEVQPATGMPVAPQKPTFPHGGQNRGLRAPTLSEGEFGVIGYPYYSDQGV